MSCVECYVREDSSLPNVSLCAVLDYVRGAIGDSSVLRRQTARNVTQRLLLIRKTFSFQNEFRYENKRFYRHG